jgi:UDP-N-acetylglucosamine:LPS N-acetylglucosamine transferase
VIPAFVNKAFAGEPLTLAGDGLQSRRFVYVEDLAEGVVCGLADIARNRVYNLASDANVTIREIAETVQELVGNTEIVFTPARPGDFGGKVVSSERARVELGWTAATPFAEGVRRYVEWRRDQATLAAERADAAVIPAGEPDTEAPPRHVLIISADIGEGHDLPARAVAREFRDEDPDAQVAIVNGLPAMGPLMTHVLRENSAFMFRWVPWLFDLQYRLFMNFAPTRWLSRRLLTLFGKRGLMRLIRAHNPDVIVSTYPGVTAILGELRRRGRLDVPCYSSITDLAGLQFWAHPGIDLHFITHPESTEEVEQIAGPGSVRWAKPPTSPAFLSPRSRDDARRALGLPVAGKVIAVSGGGWGVGDLVGATSAALEVPDATVLCLCGRNDEIRQRVTQEFAAEPRLKVMGFTDRMGDVLAAADALIHSSAGLTVLEAIIRGCPVISYGFGYGHVNVSNHALERFGLAQVARHQSDIAPALERALSERPAPDESFARRPSTASLILGNERRARALPSWRVRTVRAATAGFAALALALWSLTAGLAFSLVSAFAHTSAVTKVRTAMPEVGVMVDTNAKNVAGLARFASAHGIHLSFAVWAHNDISQDWARVYGDEALPRLPDGGLIEWAHTKSQLRKMARELGCGHHFLYASSGPSLGQWLFASSSGGELVAGAVKLNGHKTAPHRLRAGEVIELRVENVGTAVRELRRLDAALTRSHLVAVPVTQLLHDSGTPV